MKKLYSILLVAISVIIFANTASAQRFKHAREIDAQYFPRHEIYIQYGTPTVLELVTMLPAPKGFEADTKNLVFSGTPGIGYNFSISETFSMGIFAGYSYSKADIYTSESAKKMPDQLLWGEGVHNYVGQLSANWIYFERGALELSTGLYLGVSYWDEDIIFYKDKGVLEGLLDEDYVVPHSAELWKVSYHFTACKVRYGNTFGVFGELGFGYRGLINVGISVKI